MMRSLGKKISAAMLVLAAVFVSVTCKQGKIIDLFGVLNFVYFVQTGAGEGNYEIRTRQVSFRKGSVFTERDSEALFKEFQIDKFTLLKFFIASDGSDLVKSKEYVSPYSMPDGKVGIELMRRRSNLKELDLTSYFFAESTNLYAYYNSVPITGISFKEDYSAMHVSSSDSLQIEVAIEPEDAAVKDVTWTVNTELGNDNVVKVINPNTKGLVLDTVAMVPGRYEVQVETIDGEFSDSCEITVSPFVVSDPIDVGRYVHLDNYLVSEYKTGFTWTSEDENIVTFSNPNKPYMATGTGPGEVKVIGTDSQRGLEFHFILTVVGADGE